MIDPEEMCSRRLIPKNKSKRRDSSSIKAKGSVYQKTGRMTTEKYNINNFPRAAAALFFSSIYYIIFLWRLRAVDPPIFGRMAIISIIIFIFTLNAAAAAFSP